MSIRTNGGMALAPTAPFLEQLAGADKGKIFELGGMQLTIGRAREADIIVQSEAVSRLHARLVHSDGAWFIRDNGSKNGIVVNGKNVRESWLADGDIVQVGDFVFRFNDPSGGASAPEPAVEAAPAPMSMEMAPLAADPMAGAMGMPAAAVPKKKGPNKRVLLYGGLLLFLGLFYMMQGEEGAKPEKAGEQAAEGGATKLARDFDLSEKPNLDPPARPKTLVGIEDPILKEAERQMAALDWTNTSLRQAEQFFKRGQREYLNKNYQRSIEFFQTALQLYRSHFLADRYLKRAVYEAEALAKEHMALGIRYYQALQYQRAIYHFNEVNSLMAHRPGEAIINEANKYIETCKKMLRAAELFP